MSVVLSRLSGMLSSYYKTIFSTSQFSSYFCTFYISCFRRVSVATEKINNFTLFRLSIAVFFEIFINISSSLHGNTLSDIKVACIQPLNQIFFSFFRSYYVPDNYYSLCSFQIFYQDHFLDSVSVEYLIYLLIYTRRYQTVVPHFFFLNLRFLFCQADDDDIHRWIFEFN